MSENPSSRQTVNELVLNKIHFAVRALENCYPQNLKYDFERDYIHDRFIHCLTWNLLGKEIEIKQYPSTWWDAFKNRWFPKFLRKRFPVNWDKFKLYNICPHINYLWNKHSDLHIHWIEENHGFDISNDTVKKEEENNAQ